MLLIIQIIKLDLHHFDLGVLGQDLLQHICPIMERDSEVTDLPFLFQLQRSFISTAFFKESKIVRALRMHQIEVKIIHAARLQLTLKKRTDVLFRFKKEIRQFIGEYVSVAGITACQAFAESRLAESSQVSLSPPRYPCAVSK